MEIDSEAQQQAASSAQRPDGRGPEEIRELSVLLGPVHFDFVGASPRVVMPGSLCRSVPPPNVQGVCRCQHWCVVQSVGLCDGAAGQHTGGGRRARAQTR